MMREDLDASEVAEGGRGRGLARSGDCSADLEVLAFIERTFEPKGGGVGPRCSFCGTDRGPFHEVEVGLRLQMCPDCQVARGQGPEPLLAAYDPGQPYLQWTCALCPHQVFWPGDLEGHTTAAHSGWTATFEIVQPYPRQRLRVVYRRSDGPGSGA